MKKVNINDTYTTDLRNYIHSAYFLEDEYVLISVIDMKTGVSYLPDDKLNVTPAELATPDRFMVVYWHNQDAEESGE